MCWHHPTMVALNRVRFISRQRSLRVSWEAFKPQLISTFLQTYLMISPFLLQQDQTCFYTFSKHYYSWWSQPVYPRQSPLRLQGTPGAICPPSPPSADNLLSLTLSPAYFISSAALNSHTPSLDVLTFCLSASFADQLPGHRLQNASCGICLSFQLSWTLFRIWHYLPLSSDLRKQWYTFILLSLCWVSQPQLHVWLCDSRGL